MRDHRRGDHLGGEGGVDVPERAGVDPLRDQFLHPRGREPRCCARRPRRPAAKAARSVDEPRRRGAELAADGREVGGDPLARPGDRGDRGLDPRGGARKKCTVAARTSCSLTAGERVERATWSSAAAPASSSSVRWAKPSRSSRSTSASNSSVGAGRNHRCEHIVGHSTHVALASTIGTPTNRISVLLARRPPWPSTACCPPRRPRTCIELTRDIADKELAPRVDEHEKAETYPEGLFATLGEAGLLEPALPRGVRRRRPALRGLPAGARGARRALGRGRRRDERAQPVLPPAVHVRHRGAEAAVAARRCWAATRSAPTACPSRRPAPTPPRCACKASASTAGTGSPAPRPGSPTAASPTSTPCSPAPARARAASRASWSPATPRA